MGPTLAQARKEETRRRILDAAARLFLDKGVEGVGVDEIMREAGLTHGGFYVHFPSKEALVAEACLTAIDQTMGQWQGLPRKLADDQLFEMFLSSYLGGDRIAGNPACPMAFLGPDISRRENMQAAYSEKMNGLIDYIAHELGSGRCQAILALSAMVGATSLAAQVSHDKALAEEILRSTRQALLREEGVAANRADTPS